MRLSAAGAFAIAAVAYLAFRAAVLHVGFDAVAIPNFEVSNIGTLAKMTSEGRSGIPLYLYYDNCGGHLVTGLLAAPLYLLLGDSYLVLKLVPILLGLGCLAMVMRILERHASRRAAVLGGLLFVLGPPTLTKFSMLEPSASFDPQISRRSSLSDSISCFKRERSFFSSWTSTCKFRHSRALKRRPPPKLGAAIVIKKLAMKSPTVKVSRKGTTRLKTPKQHINFTSRFQLRMNTSA